MSESKAKMDANVESVLLKEIEERKTIILSKDNTKPSRTARSKAWSEIMSQVYIQTGIAFTENQLQKKWSNIATRVKEKLKHPAGTGGGIPKKMSNNDLTYLRIVGEDNPKLTMMKGAIANTTALQPINVNAQTSQESMRGSQELTTTITHSKVSKTTQGLQEPMTSSQMYEVDPETSDDEIENSFLSASAKRRKLVVRRQTLDELHMEVLLLQKQKLQMQLDQMKRNQKVSHNKATQTEFVAVCESNICNIVTNTYDCLYANQ